MSLALFLIFCGLQFYVANAALVESVALCTCSMQTPEASLSPITVLINGTLFFLFILPRNLPEVRSAREVLGVPTVSARFGTAPFFWNWAMEAMTSLLPAVCSYITKSFFSLSTQVKLVILI